MKTVLDNVRSYFSYFHSFSCALLVFIFSLVVCMWPASRDYEDIGTSDRQPVHGGRHENCPIKNADDHLEQPDPIKNLNELAKAQLHYFSSAAEALSASQGEIEELSVAAEGEYRSVHRLFLFVFPLLSYLGCASAASCPYHLIRPHILQGQSPSNESVYQEVEGPLRFLSSETPSPPQIQSKVILLNTLASLAFSLFFLSPFDSF